MKLSSSRLLVVPLVALALALAACGGEEPDTATVAPPDVPALHPEVDGLDATEVVIDTAGGEVTVAARVADEPASRRRGLMEVPEVPAGAGLLFLFEADTDGEFWMKDTLVPLDIAFVDADGLIVGVQTMEPCDAEPCPRYGPDRPYRAALEVPEGWFADEGVAVGDRVRWDPPVSTERSR